MFTIDKMSEVLLPGLHGRHVNFKNARTTTYFARWLNLLARVNGRTGDIAITCVLKGHVIAVNLPKL